MKLMVRNAGICGLMCMAFMFPQLIFSQTIARTSYSKNLTEEMEPLTIGSRIPDVEFTVHLNGKTKRQRLSDLQGEVIILDFWATWCGACVKGFPKMDSMQRYFGGKLDVLLVNALQTGDTEEKVKGYFDRREKKTGTKLGLACIINDSTFSKYFPHTSVPHYVWLDKDRNVLAVTLGNEISKEIIGSFIKGERPVLHEKKEVPKEHETKVKNLLDFKPGDKNVLHQSVLTGYQADIGGSGSLTMDGIKQSGFYILYGDRKSVV